MLRKWCHKNDEIKLWLKVFDINCILFFNDDNQKTFTSTHTQSVLIDKRWQLIQLLFMLRRYFLWHTNFFTSIFHSFLKCSKKKHHICNNFHTNLTNWQCIYKYHKKKWKTRKKKTKKKHIKTSSRLSIPILFLR